ncbi:hypothetical protein [Streptomyces sp. A1136]|uniref:hypothetical protein n=1 Tax=Streptomyces sp. A1136 TaxID=2563102 RepID=UPI001F0D3385|nr:hypothetical protein [Streptomyces sp. A1136]
MIIAAGFPKQVTHTVVWLSEMNLDIDLIEVGLWRVKGQLVAGFTKVYSTPEVEEFTLAPARIEAKAAAQKLEERSRARNAVHVLLHAAPELVRDGYNEADHEGGARPFLLVQGMEAYTESG